VKRTTLAGLALFACSLRLGAVQPEILELRNRAFAELENEQPANAAELYRRLIKAVPDDPLGHANLAIAALRQQQFEEALASIDRALALDAGSGRLLTIKGDVLQWSGDSDEALIFYRKAAEAAPEDIEVQYALYRHLTTVSREPDEPLIDRTLARLVAMRPENLLVLLQQGRRALAAGDRKTASGAFLRIGDLIWQAPTGSDRLHQAVIDALKSADMSAAALPAQRLENVLKITAMYRESLRELNTGIQGIPLERLVNEPPVTGFGDPGKVEFVSAHWAETAGVGSALVAGDFDDDQRSDIARITALEPSQLEVRLSSADHAVSQALPADGITGLLATDLDNDGSVDLVGFGPKSARYWRGSMEGTLTDATADSGFGDAVATAAAVIDFDIEGDLDLVMVSDRLELYLNSLQGALVPVGSKVLPAVDGPSTSIVASDLDRDGDLDLALAGADGIRQLDNLRQGQFKDRTEGSGLGGVTGIRSLVSADLDDDGYPELVAAGTGVEVLHNDRGRFSPWPAAAGLRTSAEFASVAAFDADNDGRLDLALAGSAGVVVAGNRGDSFAFLPIGGGPGETTGLVPADLDGDGDLDLVSHGPAGLYRLVNEGGNSNRWLTVRLRGLTKGNSKNNVFGVGSVVEVRTGGAYQFREAAGDSVHFGLGSATGADLLRVEWTNGVPQNRLDPQLNQWIVEEQLLKGSCPFLYVLADGEMRFVTDLLWNAPAGLPVAPGVYAPADPTELVVVGEVEPTDGRWDLRITEELWEAAFFDYVRLWVVDHPDSVEVATNLKVGAGGRDDRVLGSHDIRPVVAAWDASGSNVTETVARRDDVYADGWSPSPYQGVASEPWAFTFDLGTAPDGPIRLLLDGWIFPADASLNLAVAQRTDLSAPMPRLEVETLEGWQPLLASMGHPAGKTKTLVVDTPPLPPGASRLRIVSGQWLSWDRIAWTSAPADDSLRVAARLAPATAQLAYRGFSAIERLAPNAPHSFDYSRVTTESPWLVFPGHYTRYGEVAELLAESDDRSVILAAGDEMRLIFDATDLPEVAPGWRRTLVLESHGWDKDADRNTYAGDRVEPLPFRAMEQYGEPFPDTPHLETYRREWLTREVTDTQK